MASGNFFVGHCFSKAATNVIWLNPAEDHGEDESVTADSIGKRLTDADSLTNNPKGPG